MIEITRLVKSFGSLNVLKGMEMRVEKGEIFSILGKSGSGKSVTLKCIVGLVVPDAGDIVVDSVRVDADDRKSLAAVRKKIGYLFQGGALYDSMTILDNLIFNLSRHRKMQRSEAADRSRHYLSLVGLKESLNKLPSELSGGMKKRAALARALVIEPEILLCDEPTTGLDPITSREISELIGSLHQQFHVTAIVVTHDILCAGILSDRAGVLDDGMLKYTGSIKELAAIQDEEVAGYFKSPLQ